jgi:hypothetical protein
MGMGEPLDNLEGLLPALDVLTEQSGARFDAERITVCTSGLVDGIRRLAEAGRKRMGLSISLNAANDALRSRLMPVNGSQGGLAPSPRPCRLSAAEELRPRRELVPPPGHQRFRARRERARRFHGEAGKVLG